MNKRKQEGITLIALIITIIIMLILVAVTVSIAVNGNLFGKAEEAVDKTNQKVGKLQQDVDYYTDKLNEIDERLSDTECVITYNGNGHSRGNVPISETVKKGESVTIKNRGDMARPGYEFIGWNTNASATSADWEPGDSCRMSADIVLYAVWQPRPEVNYEVQWYSTDGEILKSPETRRGSYGYIVSVTSYDLNVIGYLFDEGNPGNVLSQEINGDNVVLKMYFIAVTPNS